MAATIEINGIRATINDGAWQSEDAALLTRIGDLSLPQYLPDGALAREAAEALGGSLVREDPPAESRPVAGLPPIHESRADRFIWKDGDFEILDEQSTSPRID